MHQLQSCNYRRTVWRIPFFDPRGASSRLILLRSVVEASRIANMMYLIV